MKQNPKDTRQPPGPTLYATVRAAFVASGTSLNAWCRDHGEHRQTARQVLLGKRKGPAAIELHERLLAASGVADQRRSARK